MNESLSNNKLLRIDYDIEDLLNDFIRDKTITNVDGFYEIDLKSLLTYRDVELYETKRIELGKTKLKLGARYSSIVPLTIGLGSGAWYLNKVDHSTGTEDFIWTGIIGLYGMLSVTVLGLYTKHLNKESENDFKKYQTLKQKIKSYEEELGK